MTTTERTATAAAAAGQSSVPTRPTVSVIVPAYNEAAIIVDHLTELHTHVESLSDRYDCELVVVDDGSTDETGDLADEFAGTHANTRVLHHAVNFHLGQALRYAFNTCTSDYLVVIDADLSYSPDHIERLLDAIVSTRARVVIASPYMKGGRTTAIPWLRRVASRGANRFLSLTAGGRLTTITGMVRAYDRRFLSGLNLKAMDSEINIEIVYKAQLLRARIVEIPAHLDWTKLTSGGITRRSKIRMSRSFLSSLLLGFIFRPFMFFVLPGLFLLAVAGYCTLWIGIRTIQYYGDLDGGDRLSDALRMAWDNAPYQFVIAGISVVVALQLFSLAIVAAQAKRYFEELFHLGSTVLREQRRTE